MLILIRNYCIIKIEKERVGTPIPTLSETTPHFKGGWSAEKLVGIKPTKSDRFAIATGSGLFYYNELHLYKMTMYFTSSINCFNAKKPYIRSKTVIIGFTSFTGSSTNHSLAKCLY